MPTKVFADELQGPTWDRVRAIRKKYFGDSGRPLDPEVVPQVFHHLMPYASLLTTGEEPVLEAFFDALDRSTRDALMSTIEPLVDQLRAYGLDGAEALLQGQQPMPTLPGGPNASVKELPEALVIQAIAEIMVPLDKKGTSAREETAMLDLARFYEFNEERWVRPRSRSEG